MVIETLQRIVNTKHLYKKLVDHTKPRKERTKIINISLDKNKDGIDVFHVDGKDFSRSFVPDFGEILSESGNKITFSVQMWNNFTIKG